nr:unnamed protein product [Callosobruchus chinensis]
MRVQERTDKAENMDKNSVIFHPIISSIQKMALYETKSKYYLVGSNNTQTRFRVIKIDRMEAKDLVLYDDKVEYTAEEIQNLINMIEAGNRRSGVKRVAVVGHHTIYKIEDTTMVYIPHESVRILHPDETRYVKMFQNIDLASNFYYSLQDEDTDIEVNNTDHLSSSIVSGSSNLEHPETQHYGVRTQPHKKLVWNMHLLRDALKAELHPDGFYISLMALWAVEYKCVWKICLCHFDSPKIEQIRGHKILEARG